MVRHDFEVLFDEAVLHPVLADAARLAVRDELIGIKRDLEVQVVVDHDLERLSLNAVTFIFINRLAVDAACGAETIAVDAAVCRELMQELGDKFFMQARIHVAQGVFQCLNISVCPDIAAVRLII